MKEGFGGTIIYSTTRTSYKEYAQYYNYEIV